MSKEDMVKACLNSISREVTYKIHDVNCGGCGVYAVELAKRLFRAGIRNFRIRTYTYIGGTSRNTNVKYVEQNVFGKNSPEYVIDWNMNGVDFDHVRLQWDGVLWDAYGAVPRREGKKWNRIYIMQPGYISLKAMHKICKDSEGWNSRFPREKIPAMRRIMDKHFRLLALDMANATA